MANEFTNEKYREKIKKLTLFDAILFRKAFDLNIPAAETLLRTIMENDKIKVARCKTEYTVTGLASHSVQLDLLAMDEHGRLFFKRTIDETGDAFNDGSYIIYVNGELANDHTALGRLVHEFSCLHSKDIYDETFKECVKKLKETEEGIQTMCTVMEELRNEGRDTTLIEAIKNLKITQHWTNEQALTALNIDKSKWPRIIALL